MEIKNMREITSAQNEQFKYWKSLLKSKGLKEGKHFLLSGAKLIEEVLQDPQWKDRVDGVLVGKEALPASLQSGPLAQKLAPKYTQLNPTLFEELDVLGTRAPLLVLQQPEIKPWSSSHPSDGLQVLCPLGDPQNLGALIRTAYAFGVAQIVLLKEAAHPLLPKAIKASSGAVLKLPLAYGPSIRDVGSDAVALDLAGVPMESHTWPKNLQLLLGEEGPGIPASFSGTRMTLPMKNPLESLNAAVAAGIAIYHLTK